MDVSNIEPKVTIFQALKVTGVPGNMELMVTLSDERQAFAKRLNQALDRAGFPPKGRGRQIQVARRYGVSQKGARKWLEGEAIPHRKRLPHFARDLDVRYEWLVSGEGSMTPGNGPFVPIIGTTDEPPQSPLEGAHAALGYLALPSTDRDAYALRATTSAYAPRIKAGEAILVEPSIQAAPGDEVILGLKDGRVLICELTAEHATELVFETLKNSQWRELFPRDAIAWLHVITGVFRACALHKAAAEA